MCMAASVAQDAATADQTTVTQLVTGLPVAAKAFTGLELASTRMVWQSSLPASRSSRSLVRPWYSNDAMRLKIALALATLALPAGAYGQQLQSPASQPPAQAAAPASSEALLEIYQIDLNPSGTAFALGKPVLQDGAYVFKAWPDQVVAHLDQSKVKKITPRTKDINQMVVYQLDLVPSGRMIARENPKLQGKTYVFHTWRDGTLMSLRSSDVQKVTKVTGLAAFKIQQELRGASLNANLPMQGGTATVLPGSPSPDAAAAPAPTPGQGNWSYNGTVGITDAYAPPSAVVSSPGDVPKAAPAPTPPPR